MGLDQWLYKKSYILSGNWIKEDKRQEVTVTQGGEPDPKIKSDRIKYVSEEIGYWRKANAIHKWFVDNVQDGKDDCGTYPVTRDQLSKLHALCKAVTEDNSKASELLPSQNGFFFGSTEYDEWYFKDISMTMAIIEDCLSEEDAEEFEYSSSW